MFIWLFYKLPNPLKPYESLDDQRHCSPKIHWKSVLLAIYLFGYLHWFLWVSWHTTFAWLSLKLSEWQAAFGINRQDLVNNRSISVTTAFVPILHLEISFAVNNSQNIQNMDVMSNVSKFYYLQDKQYIFTTFLIDAFFSVLETRASLFGSCFPRAWSNLTRVSSFSTNFAFYRFLSAAQFSHLKLNCSCNPCMPYSNSQRDETVGRKGCVTPRGL